MKIIKTVHISEQKTQTAQAQVGLEKEEDHHHMAVAQSVTSLQEELGPE